MIFFNKNYTLLPISIIIMILGGCFSSDNSHIQTKQLKQVSGSGISPTAVVKMSQQKKPATIQTAQNKLVTGGVSSSDKIIPQRDNQRAQPTPAFISTMPSPSVTSLVLTGSSKGKLYVNLQSGSVFKIERDKEITDTLSQGTLNVTGSGWMTITLPVQNRFMIELRSNTSLTLFDKVAQNLTINAMRESTVFWDNRSRTATLKTLMVTASGEASINIRKLMVSEKMTALLKDDSKLGVALTDDAIADITITPRSTLTYYGSAKLRTMMENKFQNTPTRTKIIYGGEQG